MNGDLLQTKLYVPRLRPSLVPRPHLIEKLNQGLPRKLTLISAPAGFGKTTLVSEWIAEGKRPFAWLSLDERDSELTRFLAYFIAALQTLSPEFGKRVSGLLESPQLPATEAILTTLLNEIAIIPQEFALVLDDYHVVNAPAVARALTFLLEHLPPQMHLVITTRADPPLPLARLRARGEINEIRAQDLMFSPEETAVFLNQRHQLNLPATDLLALTARTEGWAAGLQLAALSLKQLSASNRHQFITDFAGEDRYILDYLLSEVLQQQSADRQTFLLRTSLLEELNADLCAAVTGYPRTDMQAILQTLEQENVFLIPLDNRRETYRYHHLFADLLRSRLTQQLPETVTVVHQRASEWFAAHDRLDAAITHSLAAGNTEQAADLLASEALLRHATPGQILGWLDQLPEAVLASHPRLAIRQLWVLLESGQLDEVEARLLVLAPTAVGDADLAQELLVIQIHLARHQQNSAQAIALSQELLAQLPTPPTPNSLPRQLAAVFGLAEAYRLAEELDAAQIQFEEAARLSELVGSPTYVLRAQLGAAQVQVEQGKWETAVPILQKISDVADDFPQEAALAQSLLAQAPTVHETISDTFQEPLTDRELDVLRWLDSDLTMAEIGAQLFISANTVKTHLKRIYAKLGARGRYEAVAIAKENDLL
jgi:LuxR family maltose regulon positive regulatory protein